MIDTRTRIEAQRRSIARITVLFDQAESIRDIMAIEAELLAAAGRPRLAGADGGLPRRPDLDVDDRRQHRPDPGEEAKAEPEDDEAGFVAGFKAGWDGLTTFAVGLATVLGALLPWLVVLAIARSRRRCARWSGRIRRRLSPSRPGRTPSAA